MVAEKSGYLVVVLMGFSVYLGLSKVVIPEQCLTPNEKQGQCVLLDDCPSIRTISNDFETPMTLERLNFLINSQCQFKGGLLTVCCSNEELSNVKEIVFQPLQEDISTQANFPDLDAPNN